MTLNNRLFHNPKVAEIITSCPVAGQGVHSWIWRAAIALRGKLSPKDTKRLLRVASRGCGRDCSREIQDAVSSSLRKSSRLSRVSHVHPRASASRQSRVIVNDPLRREIVRSGPSADSLTRISPTKIPTSQSKVGAFVLDRLFPGDPLLCVALAADRHEVKRKSDLLAKPYLRPLIVPSPMSRRWGLNQQGHPSQRCLDNTGPRIYVVCEFDLTTDFSRLREERDRKFVRWAISQGITIHDISASLLLYLAKAAPLVLVVDSGGKSLHGWFKVENWKESKVMRFMALAICLGADPATRTKCQLVRMPGAVRRTDDFEAEAFQRVLYFDASQCAALGGTAR